MMSSRIEINVIVRGTNPQAHETFARLGTFVIVSRWQARLPQAAGLGHDIPTKTQMRMLDEHPG
jgi:hypothetical protein